MTGRIFLIRDRTYCAIWDFPGEPISIIGEIHESLTDYSITRTPIVVKYKNEPIICPYCMCAHMVGNFDGIEYPPCDPKRRKSILKDELNIEYHPKLDGYYVQHI